MPWDSTRAMRRCLDVLNALGTDLQGLLEVGVDAGPVNGGPDDLRSPVPASFLTA